MFAELASRLGAGARFTTEPRAVFEEPRRASAGGAADRAGVTWERVDAEDGVFRPCPSVDRPGTPWLFLDSPILDGSILGGLPGSILGSPGPDSPEAAA
ncbi:hypothetical protein Psuf_040960 [Phytohabitans suffuscus]|uniref:Uncharacterized protein n=1 Tax=Phytohabitans suffuscus TaxID=624315 RepID=A0A6F8YL59_9ACTN|nr:hypothetical protein Psuf_040960 [Phytohabitans suffuscus]